MFFNKFFLKIISNSSYAICIPCLNQQRRAMVFFYLVEIYQRDGIILQHLLN